MMKKMIIVFWVLCLSRIASAQTWDEWFRQKQTQIKYLLEQVAALKAYGAVVEKGYAIAKIGLGRVAWSKKGDLNQHRQHFASLLKAKPCITDNSIIESVLAQQKDILAVYNECKRNLSKGNDFSTDERHYFEKVLEGVLNECYGIVEQVQLLTSDGLYQMNDDERLRRLQASKKEMEELHEFTESFKRSLSLAAMSRLQDGKNMKRLRSIY